MDHQTLFFSFYDKNGIQQDPYKIVSIFLCVVLLVVTVIIPIFKLIAKALQWNWGGKNKVQHKLECYRVPSAEVDSVLFGELWILRKAYWPADTIERYRDYVKKSNGTFVIFRDSQDGSVRGCYCEQVRDITVNGQNYRVIYLGNAFTYTYYRGTPYFGQEFTRSIFRQWLTAPRGSRCIILLAAMSYKIYVVAARTYPNMYPTYKNHKSPEFNDVKEVVGNVVSDLYPEYWDPSSYLIRLKGSLFDAANISDDMLEDPDIRFFKEINPDYSHGCALPCFFEVTLKSVLHTMYKLTLRSLGLDRARKVKLQSISKKAASRKDSKIDKVVQQSLIQRDIARTYVLPPDTALGRTYMLSEKISAPNPQQDILSSSLERQKILNELEKKTLQDLAKRERSKENLLKSVSEFGKEKKKKKGKNGSLNNSNRSINNSNSDNKNSSK